LEPTTVSILLEGKGPTERMKKRKGKGRRITLARRSAVFCRGKGKRKKNVISASFCWEEKRGGGGWWWGASFA